MAHVMPYLMASILAIIATDRGPSVTRQIVTWPAPLSAETIQTGKANSAGKGDRLQVGVEKRVPVELLRRQARDPKPRLRERTIPIGCDPLFSPVAAPLMAHLSGRCLVTNDAPTRFAQLHF